MFRFKQFSVKQEHSAMKIGTDGVLLGAWVPIKDVNYSLDIGTGTGLIALMLAQRNLNTIVDAVEVDKSAFLEADFNFNNSKWVNRLRACFKDIKDFNSECKYDLIVSNPPYFLDGFDPKKNERAIARHVGGLNFDVLLQCTVNLLSEQGRCSFILPYKEFKGFVKLANEKGLFLEKATHVKGRQELPYKRSLLLFSKNEQLAKIDELVIEIERHVYTKEYISLTQDFYLKM